MTEFLFYQQPLSFTSAPSPGKLSVTPKQGVKQNHYMRISQGVTPIRWILWLTRTEFVLNKCQPKTFL